MGGKETLSFANSKGARGVERDVQVGRFLPFIPPQRYRSGGDEGRHIGRDVGRTWILEQGASRRRLSWLRKWLRRPEKGEGVGSRSMIWEACPA